MLRAWAVLLAFVIGVFAQPVRADVHPEAERSVVPGAPGDVEVNTQRRESIVRHTEAVQARTRGTADVDDGELPISRQWNTAHADVRVGVDAGPSTSWSSRWLVSSPPQRGPPSSQH